MQIAIAVGASQSQVSRVLSGHSVRRSKLFDVICKYVYSADRAGSPHPEKSAELMDALRSVWDGSPRHAKALALVIRSLGELTPTGND